MTKVILISGKAEAGKTATANILKDLLEENGHSAAIVPYAAYVKETAKLLFNWDGVKDEAGRKLLQWWGTDIVRAKFPDFWVETVQRLIYVASDLMDYILIDDVRFPNEIESWEDYPVMTVRVERPLHRNSLTAEQRQHISETALDQHEMDVTLVANDYEELWAEVCELYNKMFEEDEK